MDFTKLRLSEEELRLVTDPGFILTKNVIISKVYLLFGFLAEEMSHELKFPDEVARISAKIAKGENYLGLPYVMLDLPRFFTAEHTVAIRTFFWWGNFFSITLHLKGKFQYQYANRIIADYKRLSAENYAVAISEDEWQHHIGDEHYKLVKEMSEQDFRLYINQHPYVKISLAFPLSRWSDMHIILKDAYINLGKLIS
jgi:hypothetical protein